MTTPPSDAVRGQWPVHSVGKRYGDPVLYPESDVHWTELVDLSVFEGFWPGMKGKEAVESVGLPDDYKERNGEKIWVYQRPGAKVVVALRDMQSTFGKWWRLDAFFDAPVEPSELLHSSVVAEIPPEIKYLSLKIMNGTQGPGAIVRIEGGRIVSIDWVNNPGSGGAKDRSRSRAR